MVHNVPIQVLRLELFLGHVSASFYPPDLQFPRPPVSEGRCEAQVKLFVLLGWVRMYQFRSREKTID